MTDKIIFLDIDGPMIPYRALFLPGQTTPMELFDPVAVSLLNNLCSSFGWKIVVHSSWIWMLGGDYTINHCVKQGIKPEHFHTESYCKQDINWRYDRVAEWLNRHPEVIDYAIVDDEPFKDSLNFKYPEGMSLHMVLVNYYVGFTFETYNQIKAQSKPEIKEKDLDEH